MYLGIDLGTSSVKVILMDHQGKLLDSASSKYPLYYPKPNYSEQNPTDWWDGTKEAIQTLAARQEKQMSQVEGISFSGQMHGLVLLDEAGEVLRPAILWNDNRTQDQCDFLNEEYGIPKLSKATGNLALCGFTAPKVLWVKENELEVFAKVRHVLLPKDYIRYKLTGEYKIDTADAAGTLFFDVENRCWSKEIVSLIGLKEEYLPEVFESFEVTGTIAMDIAKELGLPPNAKVIGGGGDQAVGAVGTGTVDEGVVSVALGTSGAVLASTSTYKVDTTNRLHSFCHANGKYMQMGVMLSAAYCLQWWVEEVNKDCGAENPYQVLGEEASKVPAGSNGLIFLPYLTGERTPYADVNARGTFIGLSPLHTRGHMTRAVLEGVGYGLRDSLEIMKDMDIETKEIRITGGGVRNPLWVQIIASIFNQDLHIVEASEGPAYGAAILASVGCGQFETVEAACEAFVKPSSVVSPNASDAALYEKGYQVFRGLYPALKESFKALQALNE
jgi:xylulokinase